MQADATMDPFAAIAKPAAQAAPAQSPDPFSTISKPAAAGEPGLGGWAGRTFEGTDETNPNYQNPEAGGIIAGAVKSAGGAAGGVLDMLSHAWAKAPTTWAQQFKAKNPGASDDQVDQAFREADKGTIDAKIQQHVQDAATWLRSGSQSNGMWEGLGAIGEQVLEYLGTDGLLKMVGGGAAAAEAAAAANKSVKATDDLKKAQQVATTLSANPKLAGLVAVGIKASKDAALMGGQAYLHTEDLAQAAVAAGTGGVLRGAGEAVSAAGRYLQKVSPTAVKIAGIEIPVLASQLNEAGAPIEGGAEGAPKIAAQQQIGAQQAIGNVAKAATRAALQRINQTRPAAAAIEDAGRMLPAGEGGKPFTFTLNGTPVTEQPTGELLQSAAQKPQAAFKDPQFLTSSAATRTAEFAPNGRAIAGPEGSAGADIRTAGAPEAAGEIVGGGGVLQTTNPQTAESWLRQLEETEQGTAFKGMSAAQQDAITAERQRLEEQLGLYHASPYAQRFDPVDVESATDHVRTFGDAADQVQTAAKPIYSKLDQVSGGQFDKLNKGAKQALRIMRSATSTDAYETAQQKYSEATGAISDLINRHAGDVNRADYNAAKLAWRDSSRLNELHAVFERMMNGVTVDESDQGLNRVMTGRTKQLEQYLSKSQNREQIEQLIGTDGVTNLKKMTQLMSKAGTNRGTVDVAKRVWDVLGSHARAGGAGGLVGGAVAHFMGVPLFEGMATGAAASEGVRSVVRSAMTNPRIGNMVDYAVEHGVSPEVYAPLIGRSIIAPFEQSGEPQEEEPQQ